MLNFKNFKKMNPNSAAMKREEKSSINYSQVVDKNGLVKNNWIKKIPVKAQYSIVAALVLIGLGGYSANYFIQQEYNRNIDIEVKQVAEALNHSEKSKLILNEVASLNLKNVSVLKDELNQLVQKLNEFDGKENFIDFSNQINLFIKQNENLNTYINISEQINKLKEEVTTNNKSQILLLGQIYDNFKIEYIDNPRFSNKLNELFVKYNSLNQSLYDYKEGVDSLKDIWKTNNEVNALFKEVLDISSSLGNNKGITQHLNNAFVLTDKNTKLISNLLKDYYELNKIEINFKENEQTVNNVISTAKELLTNLNGEENSYSILFLILALLGLVFLYIVKVNTYERESLINAYKLDDLNLNLEDLKKDVEIHQDQKKYEAKMPSIKKNTQLVDLIKSINDMWVKEQEILNGLKQNVETIKEELIKVTFTELDKNKQNLLDRTEDLAKEIVKIQNINNKNAEFINFKTNNIDLLNQKNKEVKLTLDHNVSLFGDLEGKVKEMLDIIQLLSKTSGELIGLSKATSNHSEKLNVVGWNISSLSNKKEINPKDYLVVSEKIGEISKNFSAVSDRLSNISNGVLQNFESITKTLKEISLEVEKEKTNNYLLSEKINDFAKIEEKIETLNNESIELFNELNFDGIYENVDYITKDFKTKEELEIKNIQDKLSTSNKLLNNLNKQIQTEMGEYNEI